MKCIECEVYFEDEDNVNECQECNEIVCNVCKDGHNCIIEDDNFQSLDYNSCVHCSLVYEDMLECNLCSDTICHRCKDEHIDNHKEDIKFTESNYSDYVSSRTAEEL